MQRYNKRGRKLNTYPLRKIIGTKFVNVGINYEMFLLHEELECGHVQLPKHDIFGETNATRRRCRECGKENEGR